MKRQNLSLHRLSILPLIGFLFLIVLTTSAFTLAPKTSLDAKKALSGGGCSGVGYGSSSNANVASNGEPPMYGFEGSNSPSLGISFYPCPNQLTLTWSDGGYDFYQVRWTQNGSGEQQYRASIQTQQYGYDTQTFSNLPWWTTYTFYIQGCTSHWYGSSCTDWSPTVRITTGPVDACLQGYVWREANSYDHVCVTSQTRDQAAYDNSQAGSRIDPYGAYGPYSCVQGYVWREAFSGDLVCVTPDVRSQAAYDNSQANYRLMY